MHRKCLAYSKKVLGIQSLAYSDSFNKWLDDDDNDFILFFQLHALSLSDLTHFSVLQFLYIN